MSSELARLLAKYPNPNDPRYAPQVEGKGNELRRQFPGTYGAIGGFMGTAPDEFERGSVLDLEDAAIDAQVRKGAEMGYPVGLAASVAPVFSGIGQLAAKYGPVAARNAMAPTQLSKQAGVIKMKGGNWLSGSVEDGLKGLKRDDDLVRFARQNNVPLSEERLAETGALNDWIDKQLTRYVKNEMATPEDPIRALAERGVLHVGTDQLPDASRGIPGELGSTRVGGGFPSGGLGTSDTAKSWELASDSALHSPQDAGDLLKMAQDKGYDRMLNKNPWLAKVPPETQVNEARSGLSDELGFNHLIDELRNATDPASNFPADLRLKYEALDKVSVPQAVERVAKINAWREAQAAQAKQARLEGIPVHKEYPEGFRWLKVPDTIDNPQALKYAEESGCVGKWCTQSKSAAQTYGGGRGGRLFQLVDKKGEPHVQVQVSREEPPNKFSDIWDSVMQHVSDDSPGWGRLADYDDPFEAFKNMHGSYVDDPTGVAESLLEYFPEARKSFMGALKKSPDRISEIKGKANRAPNPEYLPYVQDFVKSGKWSDVGDLQNTGLIKNSGKRAEALGRYSTDEELTKYLDQFGDEPRYAKGGRVQPKADCGCNHKGYAEGGLVQYDPDRISSMVADLRKELAF